MRPPRWTGSLLLALTACGDPLDATATGTISSTSDHGDVPTGGAPESGPGATTTHAPTTTASNSTSATSSSTTAAPSTSSTTATQDVCSPPAAPPAAVPLNDACSVPQQTGSFDLVIEWSHPGNHYYGPPAAGQTIDSNDSGALDAGDRPLVFMQRAQEIFALWGDGSGVAWKAAITGQNQRGGPSLGDLDGDGWIEVVSASSQQVCAYDGRDGAVLWCTPLAEADVDPTGYNFPALGDMDGDGLAEVAVGRVLLDHTGAVIGIGAHGKGAAPGLGIPGEDPYGALSALVDLDADGVQELVTGDAAYDIDGNTLWFNGEIDGLIAVADFDLDGAGEIVKTCRTDVFGLESDGTPAWGPVTYDTRLGVPAIDDLDGDGTPEILFAARFELVAMDWGGHVRWTAPITDESGSAGPVLFDFDGDGYPEVVIADEQALRLFSGLDGSPRGLSTEHASSTALETPIVADVDGDGHVEIVVGHSSTDNMWGSLSVYGDADDLWPPGRKIWNQATYSITNVGGLGKLPLYQANWIPGFNNFRSGDAGQPPGHYHDLSVELLDVCADHCSSGTVLLAARVRNAGTVEAPAGVPVTVRAGPGGEIVATVKTTEPVPSGQTGQLLLIDIPADALARSQPAITVDDDGLGGGVLFECDETNNTAVWPDAACKGVPPN